MTKLRDIKDVKSIRMRKDEDGRTFVDLITKSEKTFPVGGFAPIYIEGKVEINPEHKLILFDEVVRCEYHSSPFGPYTICKAEK